jgi:hypothetical protein
VSSEPLTPSSNETSLNIPEQVANESLPVDECVLPSSGMISNSYIPLDDFQTDIQLKNKICGEISYILKQARLASKVVDMSFDDTISMKNFLTETTSCLGKLKESINDLLFLCDTTLEKNAVFISNC